MRVVSIEQLAARDGVSAVDPTHPLIETWPVGLTGYQVSRPKFSARIRTQAAAEFVQRVARQANVVDDPAEVPAVTRDPDDDYLVALARHPHAEAIISGDRDLLEAELTDLPVCTPRELVDRIADAL